MIQIKLNGIEDVARLIKNVNKQVAFAASRALNQTAIKVQEHEVTQELPQSLKLRSQWFRPRTKFGVNIKFARKTNLVAVVGSQADWLKLVDKGGTKKPSGKAIAIPTSNIDTSRPRRKADKPRNILKQPKAFVAVMSSGKAGIFIRVGKERKPIKPLYLFDSEAKVHDILDFFEAGKAVADRIYLDIFSKELAKAIASAK